MTATFINSLPVFLETCSLPGATACPAQPHLFNQISQNPITALQNTSPINTNLNEYAFQFASLLKRSDDVWETILKTILFEDMSTVTLNPITHIPGMPEYYKFFQSQWLELYSITNNFAYTKRRVHEGEYRMVSDMVETYLMYQVMVVDYLHEVVIRPSKPARNLLKKQMKKVKEIWVEYDLHGDRLKIIKGQSELQ